MPRSQRGCVEIAYLIEQGYEIGLDAMSMLPRGAEPCRTFWMLHGR